MVRCSRFKNIFLLVETQKVLLTYGVQLVQQLHEILLKLTDDLLTLKDSDKCAFTRVNKSLLHLKLQFVAFI